MDQGIHWESLYKKHGGEKHLIDICITIDGIYLSSLNNLMSLLLGVLLALASVESTSLEQYDEVAEVQDVEGRLDDRVEEEDGHHVGQQAAAAPDEEAAVSVQHEVDDDYQQTRVDELRLCHAGLPPPSF